jgi:hypothetical protein
MFTTVNSRTTPPLEGLADPSISSLSGPGKSRLLALSGVAGASSAGPRLRADLQCRPGRSPTDLPAPVREAQASAGVTQSGRLIHEERRRSPNIPPAQDGNLDGRDTCRSPITVPICGLRASLTVRFAARSSRTGQIHRYRAGRSCAPEASGASGHHSPVLRDITCPFAGMQPQWRFAAWA